MAKIHKLPVAHLVNPDPIRLHSQNLIEMLEYAKANQAPGLVFINRQNHPVRKTMDDHLEGARTVATYLRNRGLNPGDKVLLLLMTSSRFVDCFFGTIMAGGIPVPASPPLTFGDIGKYLSNLRHIVKNSEARFMIAFPRIRKVIGSVLADDNDLKEFILAKDITPEKPLRPGYPTIDPDEPAFYQYTSGTTNAPKGVVLTHRALLSNVYGVGQGIDIQPHDVGVTWLPLFHDMGLIGSLFSTLYHHATTYVMTPESFVMNPRSWLANITQYRATAIVAPNFAYHLCANRIADDEIEGLDLSSLKVAMNGAEPVDLRTMKKFEDKFAPVGFSNTVNFPVYGMAENCLAATFPRMGERFELEEVDRVKIECQGVATLCSENDPSPYSAISVGAPLAGQEVAISGEEGTCLEQEVGQILVKSPSLMQGYYRNEEETAKVLKNGWLHTGDLGYIKDGRLFITGRAKELIIKRGRNYYPYDIERAASGVKGVRKGCLAAFASPNPETGTEDLILVVETRETDERIKRKIERSIATEVLDTIGIKPDRTILVPPRTIPKTSSGKLQRLLCRQRYHDGILVKGISERWLTPVKALVGSFLGHQRFRLRARNP